MKYDLEILTYPKDGQAVLDFMRRNEAYFLFQDAKPVNEQTVEDFFFGTLPPGKYHEEKVLMAGFFKDELIAIFDFLKNWPEENTWVIGLMLVDENWRSQNVGTELLEDLRGYFGLNMVSKLRLGVLEENESAQAFWIKNGFKLNGQSRKDEQGRKILVMEKQQ
ncbi:MAG: GNAT family N-acetyltransferase [Saprospiraceae bacterium]